MGQFGVFSEKETIEKIKEYLANDAVVLDVRTQEEWNEGHVEGAQHIILNLIPHQVEEIKSWNKKVIAVCRSGARSGQATRFLEQNDIDVVNGGPWQNVDQFIS
ncbi:rhodanese-like domain-containing protein [Lutibacter sp. Hel_I_33_5]|uniref:rhodanese-like domain-containing protein n=1 Tax=Lutibacter sp. Hel_I_33_5 TaxID=1566289 RepID=UPI0011A29181|nr:rhodanese-like domain-containing protein [Lutibacter sp. Hel_I_33_5]TVZ56035.1 rhodanese-like domain-containing protein [Lutibacter sp. Hel_I_33_5]